jgi:hypothetical protein
VTDPVNAAIAKKNEAKNFRRAKPPNLDQAESCLKEAISILETVRVSPISSREPSPPSFSELEKSVAKELADCWGSLGGTYRAAGKLKEAFCCYEKGLIYESDPRLPANSYNLVNRLLVRLAMNSEQNRNLTTTSGTFEEQLTSARTEVARQVRGPRKRDMWAYADQLMLSILAVDLATARKAWEDFDRLAILEHAYTTTRDVLIDLSRRSTLTEKQTAAIQQGLTWFEDAIKRKAWIKT